jgi:hypothetical protein
LCGFGDFVWPGGVFPAGFVGAGAAVGDSLGDALGDGDPDGEGCGSADGDGWTGTAADGGGGEPSPGFLLTVGAAPRCG